MATIPKPKLGTTITDIPMPAVDPNAATNGTNSPSNTAYKNAIAAGKTPAEAAAAAQGVVSGEKQSGVLNQNGTTVSGQPLTVPQPQAGAFQDVAPATPTPQTFKSKLGGGEYATQAEADAADQNYQEQSATAPTFHSNLTNQDYASDAEKAAAEQQYNNLTNQSTSPGGADYVPPQTPQPETPAAPETPTPNTAQTGTPYDEQIDALKKMATGTEDPAYKVAFNRAVQSFGLANQANRDALQMRINQNPALAGQPAGTALLMMAARDANLSFDQAVAQLSEQSAQHISDMNKYGLSQLANVTAQRENYKQARRQELLNTGDLESYADQVEADTGVRPDVSELKESSQSTLALAGNISNAIQNAVASGDTAHAQALFAQLQQLQPKTYAGLQFNDYISSASQYAQRVAVTDALDTRARNEWMKVADGGDPSAVVSVLHERYPEADAVKGGDALIKSGIDLAEANRLLKQAGMDEAKSVDELTANGRQDDLFIAKQLDAIAKGASAAANTIHKSAMTYAETLGLDKTNPNVISNLEVFLRQNPFKIDANGDLQFNAGTLQDPLSYTDPNNSISQHFVDWPTVDESGKTIYAGWQPYDNQVDASGFNNQPPAPGSQGYVLDQAYEKYLNTPGTHVSRKDWFASVTGNKDNWKNGVLTPDGNGLLAAGGKEGGAPKLTGLAPKSEGILNTVYEPGEEADPTKAAAFKSAFKDLSANAANLKTWLDDASNLDKAVKFGVISDFSRSGDVPNTEAGWKDAVDTESGLVKIGDQVYTPVKSGADYRIHGTGVGEGTILKDANGGLHILIDDGTDPGKGFEVGKIYDIRKSSEVVNAHGKTDPGATDISMYQIKMPSGANDAGQWQAFRDVR